MEQVALQNLNREVEDFFSLFVLQPLPVPPFDPEIERPLAEQLVISPHKVGVRKLLGDYLKHNFSKRKTVCLKKQFLKAVLLSQLLKLMAAAPHVNW